MGTLDRRLARLEEAANAWSLTRLLDWIANPTAEVPGGALVDCLESLPIIESKGIWR